MLNSFSSALITTDDVSHLYPPGIKVNILRTDKLHPVVSGNKWFKLRFYLEKALQDHKQGLLTFGGAWSNHIVATAEICRLAGLQSVGIIRGEEPVQWSAALQDAKTAGMQLHFIPRNEYREKHVPANLGIDQSRYLQVSEGGYGPEGAKGAATMFDFVNEKFSHYICALGTGTMAAGLINAMPGGARLTAVSVLKNNRDAEQQIRGLVTTDLADWEVQHDYHFGGYAKHTPELLQFMNTFFERSGIPTDFVYTGKLFFAVNDLIYRSFFPPGSSLLLIHSGGLQGNRSLPKGTLNF